MPTLHDEAFAARKHDTITGRTPEGRTTQRVVKRGRAQVIGSLEPASSGSDEALTDDACAARLVATRLLQAARYNVVGAQVRDLERITEVAYGSFLEHRAEIERVATMTGTDVMSWEQVIHADITDRSLVAVQRSYLSGPYGDDTWDAFACPSAVYRAHTPRVQRWPARRSVRFGRSRRNDPRPTCRAGILTTVALPYAAPVLVTPLAWSLVAPTDDTERRFVGFRAVQRPASRKAKAKRAKVKREARTIGQVEAPSTVAAMAELLANVNRGERIVVKFPHGYALPITRDKSGRYAATDRREGTPVKYRTRTALSMAERVIV